MSSRKEFELSDEDLLGYSEKDLACTQCGGVFCGARTGRVYKGKPLIMCGRRDATKRVLEHLARRS